MRTLQCHSSAPNLNFHILSISFLLLDHCFMKKWAILIDPSDINGGPKGYVKLDISVVGKGDGVKPTKSGADEDDDIES